MSEFQYPERHLIILIDNEPTLIACVVHLAKIMPAERLPQRLKAFCNAEAEALIPYRNQVGKDSWRRDLGLFNSLKSDERKDRFWKDAAEWYIAKANDSDMAWALPDSWRQRKHYVSQAARDAQAANYGKQSYWDYLDQSAQEHYDYFMRHGDPATAESMFTQSLSDALRGNEGE